MRFDNILCNVGSVASAGVGDLTLAAATEGGLDFDKWLKGVGYNFVSGNSLIVPYTVIEYTSSTPTTPKQTERGYGTLTLGASITAAVLARTTVLGTSTNMDTSTPSPGFGSVITIGTAANTRVFIGASAFDTISMEPYIEGTGQNLNGNTSLVVTGSVNPGAFGLSIGQDIYSCFIWPYTMLVKRAVLYVDGTYTGQNNNAYVRLYAIGTDGRPGKLLRDFGQIGTLNSSMAATGAVATGALTNGVLLTPGEYYINVGYNATAGGTGTARIHVWASPIFSGRMGTQSANLNTMSYNNGTVSGTPNDPAAVASLGIASATFVPWFTFKPV